MLQTAADGLVFTDGAVFGDAGQERKLTHRELAAVIDAVAPRFAEAGVRIDIGGGENGDAGQGGDGRDLTRDDYVPSESVGGSENDVGSRGPERDPNIIAAGGVIAAFLMNNANFSKHYHHEDIVRVSEGLAEQTLGTSPDGFDAAAFKQGLDQHLLDAQACLEEIQAGRDVGVRTPE